LDTQQIGEDGEGGIKHIILLNEAFGFFQFHSNPRQVKGRRQITYNFSQAKPSQKRWLKVSKDQLVKQEVYQGNERREFIPETILIVWWHTVWINDGSRNFFKKPI